jgi:hypothetical protein
VLAAFVSLPVVAATEALEALGKGATVWPGVTLAVLTASALAALRLIMRVWTHRRSHSRFLDLPQTSQMNSPWASLSETHTDGAFLLHGVCCIAICVVKECIKFESMTIGVSWKDWLDCMRSELNGCSSFGVAAAPDGGSDRSVAATASTDSPYWPSVGCRPAYGSLLAPGSAGGSPPTVMPASAFVCTALPRSKKSSPC